MEETGENHWPVVSHWHNVVRVHMTISGFQTHNVSGDMFAYKLLEKKRKKVQYLFCCIPYIALHTDD